MPTHSTAGKAQGSRDRKTSRSRLSIRTREVSNSGSHISKRTGAKYIGGRSVLLSLNLLPISLSLPTDAHLFVERGVRRIRELPPLIRRRWTAQDDEASCPK